MTTSDQVVANALPVTSSSPVTTAALGDIPPPPAPGTIVTATPAVVEQGQATVLGTASPVQGGDTLVVTQSAGSGVVSLGAVQPDGTQQVIYTAPAHVAASGTDAVAYIVTDTTRNATASGSQVVTLDAGPTVVAATPVVVEHRQTTVLGTVSPGQSGDILTLTQTPGALGTVSLGAVQDDGTQKVIYTASSSIATSGTDSVAYSITDQHNGVAAAGSASVTLDAGPTISPVSPVAVEQGQTTVIGTVTPGLITDTLTLDQASGALGTLSLGAEQADGTQTVIYTAPAHVVDSGTDAISYSVTDQHGGTIASSTASVALDAGPAIVAAVPATVEHGQTTLLGTVSPGVAGDVLTLVQAAGALGVVSLGAVQADGTQQVVYTAPASIAASGTDAVRYSITDQHNDTVAGNAASVTLDAGPSLVTATPVVVEHRQTTVLGTVSPGQSGDTLTLTQAAGALGTVSLGAVQDDGTQKVIYTAPSSIATSGTDNVAYSVIDQYNGVAAAGSASVTLDTGPTINPVSPVAVEQGQTTVVGTVTPGLSTDTLTLDQASGALGTLSLGAEQADGTQTVIYTAPAHVVDGGTDAISYSVTDQHGGTIASSTASVALDAGPAIVAAVPATVEHGQTTLLGTVSPGVAGDVLILAQAAGALGTVSLGTVQADGTQQVIYTAPASIAASGTDAVRYSITDQHNDTAAGNAVSVTLDAGPSLVAATPVVMEHDQTTVLGTVSPGINGDTLTLTQAAGALGTVSLGAVQDDGTRQVIYTAPASVAANGTDTVSYSVIDQIGVVTTGATASVILDVGPSVVASIPTVLEEHQTTVIGTASPGQSGDTLSITQAAGALGTVSLGVVQPDGTQQVIYTAPGDLAASATDAISYSVVDQHGGAAASGSASVVLDAGPTIVAADPATVEERQTTVLGTVSPGAVGDVLTLTQVPGALGTVSLGTVQADGTQQIIYAAPTDVVASDTDTVKYSITDQHDGLVVSRTVPVILDAGPTITAGEPASVEQGQTTVLGTVSPGINGDTLILQKTSDALGTIELGTVNPDGTRAVIYTAPDHVTASVTDKVSYKVTDQLGSVVKSTTMSVDLDAGPAIVAAIPTVVGSGQSTILGTASPGTSGDTLTLTQASGALGTVSLGAPQADGTQQVIYVAPVNVSSSGTDTISYSVADQHGAVVASSTAAVTLMMAAFANLTVAQGSPVLPITVNVAMLPAMAGHFSNLGSGALSADGGTYSVTGTAAQVNAALHGVGFTSTQPGMVVPALQVTLAGGPGTLFDAGRGDHVTGSGSKLAIVVNATGTLLTASGSGGETLVAGAGGDTLDGAAASSGDVFFGSAAGTVFVGGAGRDTMVGGGGGGNTVTSGSGGSVIFLGGGQNLLQSHGADTLIGGGGSDTIQAGASALVAFAGSGSTSFTGGTAASTVIGGSGSLTVSGGAGGGLFYGGTGGNNLLQSGSGAASMVAGGNGDQLVATGSGRHVLVAGVGNETLKAAGSAGNDVVFGGSGADAVSLGSGSTVFLAGSGSASVSAGSGTDLFGFVAGKVGPVTISGFDAAHDRLALFGYGQNEAARAAQGAQVAGGSTVLSLSDGTHITLLGFTGLTPGSIV